jgi:hypothetical protein
LAAHPFWEKFMFKIGKSLIVTFLVIFLYAAPALAATSIPFTINMSKAVNVTGTPRIAVDVGGITPTRYATYTSGSGTSTLIFTYTMVAGDVDLDGVTLTPSIDLNGGTIKDLAGNDLTPLTFTAPNTTNVKVNYPSLGMDFVYDADGCYTLNGLVYNDLPTFLSAASGTFTRASIGTYFDSAGVLQTAASGVPRFDYDPITHAAKGILIEENRTNLSLYSEQVNNAAYNKRTCTISADSTNSTSGTTSGDKIIEDTGGSFKELQILNASVSALSYTASAYVKPAGRNYMYIYESQTQKSIVFDLSLVSTNGYYTGGSIAPSYGISSVGNGWYRVWMTWTANAGTIPYIAFGLRNATGNFSAGYTGDGASGIYIWGIQLEQGSFATSYIPTTTATVTRAADVLTVPTSGWYTSAKGTFYGQYFLGNTSTNARTVAISSGAAPFTINNPVNSAQWRNWSGASGPTATSPIIPTLTTAMKAASAWDDSGPVSTISASGSAVVTGSYTVGAYNGATMYVGAGSGSFFLDAPIKQLKYYPVRVSDAQLQLLTQ